MIANEVVQDWRERLDRGEDAAVVLMECFLLGYALGVDDTREAVQAVAVLSLN